MTIIRRSARYYWRSHLGLLLAAAVGTAVLVGALAVGDSVRHSLRRIALDRLGKIELAMVTDGRMFRAALATEIAAQTKAVGASVLALPGTAHRPDGSARANQVHVLGVDEKFWQLGGPAFTTSDDEVVLNTPLARQLGVEIGQVVLLRVEAFSALPRDAPLATAQDTTEAMRLKVKAIAGDKQFGRFSLLANQAAPLNAYVSLRSMQRKLGLAGKANLLLVGQGATLADAKSALRRSRRLADADLTLRGLPDGTVELRSDRVFLHPPVADAAMQLPGASGVMAYLVNEIRVGGRATPYSVVCGVDLDAVGPGITINRWLANDLAAGIGDELTLRYFVVGPMRTLQEKSVSLTVSKIVPIEGWAADPTLMPKFPGLAGEENCRDWDPGFQIELSRIRDKDEAYWDAHGGTPKAFVPLDLAQELWGNRFGKLTAVRFAAPLPVTASGGSVSDGAALLIDRAAESFHRGQLDGLEEHEAQEDHVEKIERTILDNLDPAQMGLVFQPMRQRAMDAVDQSLDFGQLFIGFSFFLIVSAMLLMAMLFVFGIEQRSEQIGLLLAVGLAPGRIRRLLLFEALGVAIPGCLIGLAVALAYTRLALWGLSTVWRDAIGAATLTFAVTAKTLVLGTGTAVLLAGVVLWLVLRWHTSLAPRRLLASGGGDATVVARRSWIPWTILVLAVLGSVALLFAMRGRSGSRQAGGFFGAGALLLLAVGSGCQIVLARLAAATGTRRLTITAIGWRSLSRRRGRSLATIALLAVGCFMVVATTVFRHSPAEHAHGRRGGTGGFALFAESTLPIYHDLNTPAGRESVHLDADMMRDVAVLPLRVRAGDEASCRNLNRAQVPRLVGVNVDRIASLNPFHFVDRLNEAGQTNGWHLLRQGDDPGDVVPAIVDQPTLAWALRRGLGDRLHYIDEQGRPFDVRIVGVIDTSILQGNLVIDEQAYLARFGSDSGYRMLLIDAPRQRTEQVGAILSEAFADTGLEVTPAAARLGQFLVVENTYLSIFQALGGLGLLLGTVGLGIVVLRNLLERRGELAAMRAMGYGQRRIVAMTLTEHSMLLAMGLVSGVAAAAVAVGPVLGQKAAQLPYVAMAILLVAVVGVGVLSVWLATIAATRGSALDALRQE